MIKKRKNAKYRKRIVIVPADPKRLEQARAKLKKVPPLDFKQLLDQTRTECNGMNLDDAFRAATSKAAAKQVTAILKILGLDEADPDRFVKGFVLLSAALLGVGAVTYGPAASKPVRWTKRHDDTLRALVGLLVQRGLSVSEAITNIASDPTLKNWFPYSKQSGRHDPKLTDEKRKVGALRARWYGPILEEREADAGPALTADVFGAGGEDISTYEYLLTTLDINSAMDRSKKRA